MNAKTKKGLLKALYMDLTRLDWILYMKRQRKRLIKKKFYSLSAIVAVGYRVNSGRTRFRMK